MIGSRTYSGSITEEGLVNLRSELNKGASKNTAVACFKITTRNTIELNWIVGSQRNFDEFGNFAFKSTGKDMNYVKPLPEHMNELKKIPCSLGFITGLIHDLGKNFFFFQNKLSITPDKGFLLKASNGMATQADPVRHEKISYEIFSLLIDGMGKNKTVPEQIEFMVSSVNNFDGALDGIKENGGSKRLKTANTIFEAVRQVTLSHHRLTKKDSDIKTPYVREYPQDFEPHLYKLKPNHEFILCSKAFKEDLIASLNEIKAIYTASEHKDYLDSVLLNPNQMDKLTQYILRPAFILADQNFSSKVLPESWDFNNTPYANTTKDKDGHSRYNQTLEEHLYGVAKKARKTVRQIFSMVYGENSVFGQLDDKPKSLTRQVPLKLKEQFGWQDTASCSATNAVSNEDGAYGFIGCLMAKTGAGKTVGAPKILSAANKNAPLRISTLLGMKSLTLQTFKEYQSFLNIDASLIAGIIGSSHTRDLFDKNQSNLEQMEKEQSNLQESTEDESELEVSYSGKTSATPDFLDFEGDQFQPKLAAILDAPILACTIDYIVNGFAGTRSNDSKYLIRLMTSDLIIDEIDNYGATQLASILRLVYLSGFYGRKTLVGSATVSSRLAKAIFEAYEVGYKAFCSIKGMEEPKIYAGLYSHDGDLNQTGLLDNTDVDTFFNEFKSTIMRTDTKRKLRILEVADSSVSAAYKAITDKSIELFDMAKENIDGIEFSTGLVKIANIKYVRQFGEAILNGQYFDDLENDVLFKVEVYHSKNMEIKKSYQEYVLGQLLTRKGSDIQKTDAFKELKAEAQSKGKKKVFILIVSSPIVETGRDFDFDWIINEPRDHRSLIQTFGRQYRHRGTPKFDACWVLNKSLKAFENSADGYAYSMPGFIEQKFLRKLKVKPEALSALDFEELFELSDGSFINSSVIVDDEFNHPAKQAEINAFVSMESHPDGLKNGFLKHEAVVFSGVQEAALPFRESSFHDLEAQVCYENGRFKLKSLDGLNEKSITIRFSDKPFKMHERVLCQKPLEEVILNYGYKNVDSYFYVERTIRYNKKDDSVTFNPFTGCL